MEERTATASRSTVVSEDWLPEEIAVDQEKGKELKGLRNWKKANRRFTWQEVATLS